MNNNHHQTSVSSNTTKHLQISNNIINHQTKPSMINHQFFEHDGIFKCHLKPNTPFLISFHMFNSTQTPKKQGISLPFFSFCARFGSLAMKRKKPPDPTDAPKCKEEVNSWEPFRMVKLHMGGPVMILHDQTDDTYIYI